MDIEVGLFRHVAICQMHAVWQDVRPDMDLHCVTEVSSFCLCWQMDTLYNVFGSDAHRQTACVQASVGEAREGGAERQISFTEVNSSPKICVSTANDILCYVLYDNLVL